MDEQGDLEDMEKPFHKDALATVSGVLAGTTTSGAYIGSAPSVEEGGKTALTSVVIAFLFIPDLFFYPVFPAIPPAATYSHLVIVGLLMMGTIKNIDMDDFTEMILCPLPPVKLVSSKSCESKPIAWALCSLYSTPAEPVKI